VPVADVRRKTDVRSRSAVRQVKVDAGAQTVELHRKNWILLGSAAVCILLGFLALSHRSITLAPILLLAGYLVLIPWGLVAHRKTTPPTTPEEGSK
jgi:hypothetical protein